jgi:nucleotide-binding universal stress UspA family protein
MKVARILVPLDGSKAAEAALPSALQLARASGAQLLLLRATDVRFDQEPAPVEVGLAPIRAAEAYLRGVQDRVGAELERVTAFVWRGSAAAAIVKAVRHYQIDLIVMTTHGRSGREQEMFGSVAEAVLRGVTIPVLVVRPSGIAVHAPTGEAMPWPTP